MTISALSRVFGRLLAEEQAATATEYAIMLALMLVVIIATVTAFGQSLDAEYVGINADLFGS